MLGGDGHIGWAVELDERVLEYLQSDGRALAALRATCRTLGAIATPKMVSWGAERLQQRVQTVENRVAAASPTVRSRISLEPLREAKSVAQNLTQTAESKALAARTALRLASRMTGPELRSLLQGLDLSPELRALRTTAVSIRSVEAALANSSLMVQDSRFPFHNPNQDFGYPSTAPYMFGEPTPDHVEPPNFYRDRMPPPGMDPFRGDPMLGPNSPFNPGPSPFPSANPFGNRPFGGRHQGPFYR